jgi:hypothetical protein
VAAMSRATNRSSRAPASPGDQSFTPTITKGSFIHWAVGRAPDASKSWARQVAAYLISVGITYAHDRPALPLIKDWAVAFAFWISLPAILYFIASDQDELKRAMTRVEADRIVTASKEDAKRFADRWARYFTAINIGVQIAAPFLAFALSKLTYDLFTGRDTWTQKTVPNGYAYQWGIAVFYVALIIYIVRGVAMIGLLRDLAAVWKIRISPLHPDGCGGLRPLGRIGLRNQYVLTILGVNIVVVAFTIKQIAPSLVPMIIGPALAIYLIVGPIIFIGPLMPFRDVMSERRRTLMQEVAEPLAEKFDSLKAEARRTGDINPMGIDALGRLSSFGQTVASLPVWPFDSRTMRLFATAFATPFVATAAGKLAEMIIGYLK